MNTAIKAFILVLIVLFLSVASLFFYLNIGRQPTVNTIQTVDNQGVVFSEIENVVPKSVCENKYLTWTSGSVLDTFDFKVPANYQFKNWGEGYVGFSVSDPKLGGFTFATQLIGDYAPQNVSGFKSTFEELIQNNSKNYAEARYFRDGSYYFALGKDDVIVAKDTVPSKWWMFSMFPSKSVSESNDLALLQKLSSGEDFLCFIRSVSFR